MSLDPIHILRYALATARTCDGDDSEKIVYVVDSNTHCTDLVLKQPSLVTTPSLHRSGQ